ncbi:MAG: hypothetical protein DCF17_00905 [Shackletoniella antarctica]|uniref:Ycf66 family protein n=1 Tax=Shackletoniella antarctica TaxID=268115 RepID=A0A2W4YED1_9CYAN|nr:MAG: hypothetical protein DCF17_00905 [Shackletoniella antarctica]
MLAHGLAIAIWASSLALYGAAFFFPEVHRRHDFLLSGVGAFYGLVLWFTAVQTSPTELLGHIASVVLLGWLGWQTLTLRRKRTPLDRQTPLTKDSWPALGRQLQQSGLELLRATPLGRWLPEPTGAMKVGDLAIAVAEIRASSLRDVDYEFVDELAPAVRPAAKAPAQTGSPETEIDAAKANTAKANTAKASTAPSPDSLAQRPGRSPTPQTAAPSRPPAPTAKPRGVSLGARVAGLKTWLGGVAKKAPQPQREVIEIPPRPSPLDRKKPKREVIDIPPRSSPLDRKKTQREMIDIPPRPSPLDRKKPQPAEEEAPAPETVTIVDTAAVESEGDKEAIAPEPVATAPPTDSPAETSESNWDDDDSNWLDD